ncbi:MAG: DNA recombination protein RmuC [Anaerotruncus massiliensis (ex Togo et al. 2019)]
MDQVLLWAAALFAAGACAAAIVAAVMAAKSRRREEGLGPMREELDRLRGVLIEESRQSRQESAQNITRSVNALGQALASNQQQMSRELGMRQDSLQKTVAELMRSVDARFQSFTTQSGEQLSGIRTTVENRLSSLQEDNAKKLEEMRKTVDEKLEQTLESRIGQSFKLVSERLEQVYKGLGEMQTLASGVGDLKKVLSNVKTRGVLGEVQLGAILEQILSPDQYKTNFSTRRDSRNPVEYAVVLPGDGEEPVWLPVDAKFPADAYAQLMDAYDRGDPAEITAASARRCRGSNPRGISATNISTRPVPPISPSCSLPFEGLYAQVLQLGLLEPLQRDYKVSVAGPTTMAALLNSLQMGFRTLAIQKRSGEVWQVLGAVKTEFERFGDVLGAAQQRLEEANSELDKLVGVRTRAIQRRLAQVRRCPIPPRPPCWRRVAPGSR